MEPSLFPVNWEMGIIFVCDCSFVTHYFTSIRRDYQIKTLIFPQWKECAKAHYMKAYPTLLSVLGRYCAIGLVPLLQE